ncbi:hypothetical protein DZC31_31325 (plasmid) [Stenotrophomonas rhizophila]|uniref:Uncharacterized protein n=1 Tax=Pseudomonas taiwanensis SJ9 TaxID=1388762 RepID=V7D8E3_9PSED|nr:hypothetical protein DZC31_31325 [Stenotrophomonas rhizophila]ESW38617.1 hypothetical protein O164_17235 [Pseudomonas taiwanensis SJ9]
MQGQLFNDFDFSGRNQTVTMLNEQRSQCTQINRARYAIREQNVTVQCSKIGSQAIFDKVTIH